MTYIVSGFQNPIPVIFACFVLYKKHREKCSYESCFWYFFFYLFSKQSLIWISSYDSNYCFLQIADKLLFLLSLITLPEFQ